MNTFISGLFSVLTPSVFPFLIIAPIIFEKLGKSPKQHSVNILLFGIFTILIFIGTTSAVLLINDFLSFFYNSEFLLIFNFLQIIFLIWFFSTFLEKFSTYNRQYWPIGFVLLGIIIFSYRLALSSISSAGPLIGMILSSGMAKQEFNQILWWLFTFSLGLILPFMVLLTFVKRKYDYLHSKRWWKIVQLSVAGLLLIEVLIKIAFHIINLYTVD